MVGIFLFDGMKKNFLKSCHKNIFRAYNEVKTKFKKIFRRLIKMATREENLKKINDELEKLDDEQLEQIAGGRMMFMPEQNPNTDQNTPANQVGVKKAIKWD